MRELLRSAPDLHRKYGTLSKVKFLFLFSSEQHNHKNKEMMWPNHKKIASFKEYIVNEIELKALNKILCKNVHYTVHSHICFLYLIV